MNAYSPDPIDAPVIAIVGATGVVGQALIDSLQRRSFPLRQLRLLASPRSASQSMAFDKQAIVVEALSETSFEGVDIAFFAAGAAISKKFAPLAVAAGARVIDNSSAFRMDDHVPLVVPEANAYTLEQEASIIANPNCIAAILTTALAPLHAAWSITRLSLTTYQAASGGGAAMMDELEEGTRAALAGENFEPQVLPHPYAFNFFSHNADVDPESGYNGEELKVVAETRRILDLPKLPIGVTCIRVPVLRAHGIALSVRFADHVPADCVRRAIADAPGLRLVDDWSANHFPMPSEASGGEDVLVGRIRADLGDPSGRSVTMFIVGDQLLKGAAQNAVQIAETLLRQAA
ncbi:aspartate-semialdehyde dehydrogenase [Cognatiyoonia sp. IB215446]|uniref:aspartate-semialdehyde dehydrogenase n=1 Tax=Cognatiyoonia sp. IB215446 TaxID=3097355 RepID=UPI002A0B66CE|nr:aspartate-semialdehyde dehydrogenase [Cognatiyoonia sp. IB215446]MDX8347540.1 aspartate-semialdehyde dehydrogenase [Cognatiyoonia sp. IB215446]